jgi:hypothetical protein
LGRLSFYGCHDFYRAVTVAGSELFDVCIGGEPDAAFKWAKGELILQVIQGLRASRPF